MMLGHLWHPAWPLGGTRHAALIYHLLSELKGDLEWGDKGTPQAPQRAISFPMATEPQREQDGEVFGVGVSRKALKQMMPKGDTATEHRWS